MSKIGRPSIYSTEIVDVICERLIDGQSLVSICQDGLMPSRMTAHRWLQDHAEFKKAYEVARVMQGHAFAFRVADVAERTITGEIDPAAAKVAIDAYKWVASKLAPRDFGDKLQVEPASTYRIKTLAEFYGGLPESASEGSY